MDLRTSNTAPQSLRAAVRDNVKLSRFELYVDGDNVGHLQYENRSGQIWLLHTSLDQHFKRSRLDSYFISSVLENLHRRRLGVMPFCPTVRGYLSGHPQWTVLIPAEERSRFRLTPAAKARKTRSRAS